MENFVKRVQAISLYFSPLLVIVFVAGLWLGVIKPQVIQLIQNQIPKLSSSQEFVDIKIDQMNLSLLKLQMSARDIDLQFKNDLKDFAPLHIEYVKAQLDPFKLLVGQISFSKIQIDGAEWSFVIPPSSDKPATELPMEQVFKLLPQIPIEKVFIVSSKFKLIEPKQKIEVDFDLPQIAFTNYKNRLLLSAKNISVLASENKKNVTATINFDVTLKETSLDISKLNLKAMDSSFAVSGQLPQIKKVLISPQAKLQFNSDIHFENVRNIGLTLFPQRTRFPTVTGSVKLNGSIDLKSFEDINGLVKFETTQVSIDHFKLGQAQVTAEIKKNQVFINQIDVEHPAAAASLHHIEIQQQSPYHLKAQLDLKSFDLQKLFVSLGLNNIPAGVLGSAGATCEGQLEPTLLLNCDAKISAKDIWVKTDQKQDFHIVKIKQAVADGKFTLSTEQATYQTNLQIGQSVGTSSGVVKFKEGFKINFDTNKISFSDIETLAGLDFHGELKIKGTTTGDSNAGIIDAQTTYTNAEIEKFKLGQVNANMVYEKGHLYLNQVTGTIGKSKYNGSLDFNFLKSNLNATLNFPQLEAADVQTAIQTRFELPFEFSGKGSARIILDGPFNFWKLSYDLKSQFKQAQVAGENFEQLQLNLTANGEQIQFSQVILKKSRSLTTIDGFINTVAKTPEFNLKMRAEPLQLDEVDHLIKIAPAVSGQIWLDGLVSGNLDNPELAFNFNAKQVSFEGVDYPGSQGRVIIDKKYFKFNGQMLGRQIQSDVQWPWDANNDFYLKLQIHDLNPFVFLPLISLSQPSNEYYSRVNAEIDLKSNTRSLKNSEGQIRIDNFVLIRGSQSLKLAKPSYLTFKNGLTGMEPFELKGQENSLRIQMGSVKSEEVRLNITTDLQLKLFQFLVPFSQSISGRLEIDSQVLLRGAGFELFGNGELTDGQIGFKGFPLPIDNINTPVEFSKSKILLSDITAQLGQSEVSGAGQIDIRGPRNIVVQLQADADNVELTFPDQITTAGRADISFTGNWLPYTAKINYKVMRGLVTKDFGEDDGLSKTSLVSSPFLPIQQSEQQSPSLMLDVTVDLSQGVIVKNRLLEGEATGLLKISNTPENPLITGRIDIRSGSKMFFKDKPFDVQTATIIFPPARSINPEVYISANARVSDYDINLLIQGPVKNLSIKPSSQPPLSDTDIFSLIALGVTSTQADSTLSSKTQQEQTGLEVLAAISNQSTINKKIQEKLGLTVQLAPTVDSTKNIAVPKVVVSRKIQKNVNASFSRPLTGDTQEQEWKLQYLFNPNKSVILNYQNKETNQQDQIRNSTTNETGILGLDFEYKKEFK
ncbi:MAG: translocation/assembly module TamB domain-containing protein [Bdellovibrio sp.]|nr:translocation/assembly module TamB domain-containing protein [Bdellovibrio sp.]